MLTIIKRVMTISLLCCCSLPAWAAEAPQTLKDKASYSIGVNLGTQLGGTGGDIDLDRFIEGVRDAYAGKQLKLSREEMQQALTAFRAEQQKKQQQQRTAQATKNKQEGDAFLAQNKNKKGVVTLPSGLQYQVIRAGTGASPKASDTVVTHYHGTLINGEVFDSSVQRGQPATFPVSGVIKGWTEALQRMKVGGKWKVFVPSDLAYGQKGAGARIGPNTTLIFDIELLEIKK